MESLRNGYKAVLIGASGGIGQAVAAALQADRRCGTVFALSRSQTGLDLTSEVSIAAAAARVMDVAGQGEGIDLVFDATGALEIDDHGPEKTIRALDPQAMAAQFSLNAIGPALLLKHFVPLMPRDRRCVFATLSARVGSISDNRLGGWISYRAAKAALNQIVRTASIEIARSHPQALVVALHPGTVDTTLSRKFSRNHEVLQPDDSAARLLAVIDGLKAEASGGFYAYDGQPIGF